MASTFLIPQFEPHIPRVSYSGPSVDEPLNGPFFTFAQLPHAIAQSKQAFFLTRTRLLIASELMPEDPSHSPELQFLVGSRAAFWLISTMIGVPSVIIPEWSGFSMTSFWIISFANLTNPSMSGSSRPMVPFAAMALRFFDPNAA